MNARALRFLVVPLAVAWLSAQAPTPAAPAGDTATTFTACEAQAFAMATQLAEAQRKLLTAWAARDRYRARNARLAKRAAERAAKRAAPIAEAPAAEKKSALPPGAAAILALAKAKAAVRGKP